MEGFFLGVISYEIKDMSGGMLMQKPFL